MGAVPAPVRDTARLPPHSGLALGEEMPGGAADGCGLDPTVRSLDELAGLDYSAVDHIELPHPLSIA